MAASSFIGDGAGGVLVRCLRSCGGGIWERSLGGSVLVLCSYDVLE